MIVNLIILIITAVGTFYAKTLYEKARKAPKLKNVIRVIEHEMAAQMLDKKMSESEVEKIIAQKLKKYFKNVQTQYQLGGRRGARERIDIDIDHGTLGIEIKLVKLLKKSNERNRLLGQVDLYKERKYHQNNLLILLAGQEKYQQDEGILELQRILQGKGVGLLYLKTF